MARDSRFFSREGERMSLTKGKQITLLRKAQHMKRFTSPVLSLLLTCGVIATLASQSLAGILFVKGEGITLTDGQAVVLTGADAVVLTGADGSLLTEGQAVVLTGADAVVLTGADWLTFVGTQAVVLTGADGTGLQSLDPELGLLLNNLPDTSAINVVIVFHRMPTEEDFDGLRAAGVLGGTKFRNLPMVLINAFKQQIAAISRMASVKSIYSNKTFEFLTHDTREITGQSRVLSDNALTQRNGGLPVTGKGQTVAVLDTGIDATHPDLALGSKVVQNARIIDLQGLSPAFLYPITLENLPNGDPLMGHGTFVASVLAGSGEASGNYFGGIAPGANLLGVSVGDASLFFVLSGIDYILSRRVQDNIRVVNCSFGVSGLFDANDPVNIATKILHGLGVSVVFSAGNRGDQPNALNPYSVADWVIGVASVDKKGSLSDFSSRGAAAYGLYHPTLAAPGQDIVAARAFGVNLVGAAGLAGALISTSNDLQNVPLPFLLRYTTSSGTSFAAPHVAGTIALMLEANPTLTPDEIKVILQETATPLLGYSRFEVGAGQLNTHAAVRRAGLGLPYGRFRNGLASSTTVSREPVSTFNGSVTAGGYKSFTFTAPSDTLFATVQIGWAPESLMLAPLTVTLSKNGVYHKSKPPGLLGGLTLQKTGVAVESPSSGQWTITVKNPNLLGSQSFKGSIEIVRADYDLDGIDGLSYSDRKVALNATRTGLLEPVSGSFAGGVSVRRIELARALMLALGSKVPQVLPDGAPSFQDIGTGPEAIFAESVTNTPRGDLLNVSGSSFYPNNNASRLSFAVAAVKGLGLESQTFLAGLFNPGVIDWWTIPSWARGHVAIALNRGLMTTRSGFFRPSEPITRMELARGAVALKEEAK